MVGRGLRELAERFDATEQVEELPLLGLRVCPDEFFDQIGGALSAGGWSLPPRMTA
jgi:hypothetical protein